MINILNICKGIFSKFLNTNKSYNIYILGLKWK